MAKKRAREWTDADIAALPLAKRGERHHHLDHGPGFAAGLVIRVGHKKKTFTLQMRDSNGKPLKRAIGSCHKMTLAVARATAIAWRAQVAAGQDPKVAKAPVAATTFGAVARDFVNRYARPSNKDWRESARLLGLKPDADRPSVLLDIPGGIVERWGARQIGDISKRDVIEVLDQIAVVRDAPISANRTLAALRVLFAWSVSRDLLQASPCTGVAPPGKEQSRDKVLTDGELLAIWKGAGDIGFPFGPLVQLLILTGQRRNEVAGMQWSEVDVPGKLWTLPRHRSKNDRPHAVALSSAALAVIEDIPVTRGVDFVFSAMTGRAVRGFSHYKARLDEAAGVKGWRLHDLRRTVATRMADLGIAPHVIEATLNHVSGHRRGVAGVYNRSTYAAQTAAALEQWGSFMVGLVEGPGQSVVVPIRPAAS